MKRRLLYQLTITVMFAVLVSWVLSLIICKGLRNTDRNSIGKLNYLLNNTTPYKVVFTGSSRVHTAIDPMLFDSLNQTNSFNAGMDGIQIAELNLLTNKFIQNHGAPENLFINIDVNTLTTNGVWYYPQYYPYLNDTSFDLLAKLEPKLLVGKYFPPFALTNFDDPLKSLGFTGFLKKGSAFTRVVSLRGYHPTPPHQLDSDTARRIAYFEATALSLNLLENTLQQCKKNNIRVFFIIAPLYNYSYADSCPAFFEKLQHLQTKYHVTLLNYSMDKRFDAKELFADRTHLNSVGAKLYTEILAVESKPLLK